PDLPASRSSALSTLIPRVDSNRIERRQYAPTRRPTLAVSDSRHEAVLSSIPVTSPPFLRGALPRASTSTGIALHPGGRDLAVGWHSWSLCQTRLPQCSTP